MTKFGSVFHALVLSASLLFACGTSAHSDASAETGDARDTVSDIASDGPADGHTGACHADIDCTDGVFCNGVETCMPGAVGADGRGCVAANPAMPCLASQACSEAMQRCVTQCAHATDADGDGHRAMDCGGDDCDDSDSNRFPGNHEVCDANGHDEDCDPSSFGFRDTDMDMYVDHTCCNTDSTGHMNCGDDCNDSRPNQHPALAEVCDGLDNNCDGTPDEGVQRSFYPDTDDDGYGVMTGTPVMACNPPVHTAEQVGDCNDSDSSIHPGAVEQCDLAMVDENCDGVANPPALCSCSGDVSRMCAQPGACAAGTQRCVGGGWGACSITAVAEVCNGVDDNCDGMVDEGLSVTCYLDADNDGYAAAGAVSVRSCPVPGRDAFAGCPPNQTNRPAIGIDIDCNDTDSTISPGQAELCDAAMRDENCDGVINPSSLCMCVEGQSRPCTAPGSCGAGNQTCSGGHWSSCSVNPVVESCNGIDDNCNGMVDEGLTVACYVDSDNDGYAATGTAAIQSCPVMGRDSVGGCPTNQTNRAPSGTAIDCTDTNSAISPGAIEVCDAAMVDENCDGMANPAALCACSGTATRGCTLPGACGAGTQTCTSGSWGNCSITPQTEICNGIDDNCNGMTDEGLRVTCYPDADNDGYAATGAASVQSCPVVGRESYGGCPTNQTNRPPAASNVDCNDAVSAVNPAAPEVCDAAMLDENCDGVANPASLCACSGTATRACPLPGACSAGSQTCSSGAWGTCSIGPVTEVCNGFDDNCNGTVDEGLTVTCYPDADNDGYAAMGAGAIQSCPTPGRTAVGGCPNNQTNRAPTSSNTDCNDANPSVSPGSAEVCDAAMLDENCDGTANPASLCTCSGTGTRSCSLGGLSGPCAAGTQTCSGGSWAACSIQPVTEVCNGIDDNCNGTVDESLRVTCYADADNDGYAATGAAATQQCPDPSRPSLGGCPSSFTNRAPSGLAIDCSDSNSARSPAATEVCNGIDDNCNGTTDEGVQLPFYPDADSDLYGSSSATATYACIAPMGYVSNNFDCNDTAGAGTSIRPGATEFCDGVDNNCNATIDEGASVQCYPGVPNTTFSCMTGGCAVSTCAAGYSNCDGAAANGCERLLQVYYQDLDGDGWGNSTVPSAPSCNPPVGYVSNGGDCNDTATAAGRAQNPGAFEICDGLDNNCNGMTDEGVRRSFYPDADSDLYGSSAASPTLACAPPPGYVENNLDCLDSNAAVKPGATEICDALDNNCNGTVNEAGSEASCYPGVANTTWACTAGACAVAACTGSFRNCDGTASNGCEVDINSSASNCGACGTSCGNAGVCALVGSTPTCDFPTHVAAGNGWTCVSRSSGNLSCFGDNPSGQLGLGNTTTATSPTWVTDVSGVTNVYAGSDYYLWGSGHTCISTPAGLLCAGANRVGQIGDGSFFPRTHFTGVGSCGGGTCNSVDVNEENTCAIGGGVAFCWGNDVDEQLGDGAGQTNRAMPTPVVASAADFWTDIATGSTHACGIVGGAVRCWGAYYSNEIGNGNTTSTPNYYPTPTPVCLTGTSTTSTPCTGTAFTGAVEIDAGDRFTCARKSDNTVWCWGAGTAGQLGNGMVNRTNPAQVTGLTSISRIATGAYHACALRSSDNTVWCWGGNNQGELGNGTIVGGATPVQVLVSAGVPLTGVTAISAGTTHTCALTSANRLYCWGDNSTYQLGFGDTTQRRYATLNPNL